MQISLVYFQPIAFISLALASHENNHTIISVSDIVVPTHSLHLGTISMDGLVQDCSNAIANAPELLQSCTKPSISGHHAGHQ